jgi:hypothetical protein
MLEVKKKLMVMALLLAAASSLFGCGKDADEAGSDEGLTIKVTDESTEDKADSDKAEAQTVSMYDLSKEVIEAADGLPEMTTVNSEAADADRLFSYISDVEYSKIDSFFLSYSTEGKADEIAVVKLKDISDMNEVMDSFRSHLKDRTNIYKSYGADQVKRVEDAKLYSKGDYAVLLICDNKKKIISVIDKAIGE